MERKPICTQVMFFYKNTNRLPCIRRHQKRSHTPIHSSMSSLEAKVMELWRAGDCTAFKAAAFQTRLDVWENDTMLTWVTKGPTSHAKRCEAFPNVTLHYELVRNLLDASTTSNYVYWDEDRIKRWIDMLVERQYPWFVCKSWNHLTPVAISILHECSLFHHHSSNLHKLLHQGLIEHLWNVPEFMESMNDQFAFFRNRPTGKRGTSWRREIVQQFTHYPYDTEEYVHNTVKALALLNQLPLLKQFLSTEQARMCWSPALVCICIDYERTQMVGWMLESGHLRPMMHDWYEFCCHVHPYHKERQLQGNFRSPNKYALMKMILRHFGESNPDKWMLLFTWTLDGHSFANLLVLTYRGEELLHDVWSRAVQGLANADEPLTLVFYNEFRTLVLEPERAQHEKDLFQSLERITMNHNGWTLMANALRWGTKAVVEWLIERGADMMIQCNTGNKRHNTLSLVCYNSYPSVFHDLLERHNNNVVQLWFIAGYEDVLSALMRKSLPIRVATARLKSILAVFDAKAPMPRAFKTTLVHAVMNALIQNCERPYMGLATMDRIHTNGQVLPLLSYEPSSNGMQLHVHPFLQCVLDIVGPLEAEACATILGACTTSSQFREMYRTLRDNHRMVKMAKLYVSLLQNPQHTRFVSWRYAHLCMCRCPQFRWEMQCCSQTTYRCTVLKAWACHSHAMLDEFLLLSRREWGWRSAHDWSMVGYMGDLDWIVSPNDPERNQKVFSLVSFGHYPLIVARPQDASYHIMAKVLRHLRRVLRRRANNARRIWAHGWRRVHWEMACLRPNEGCPAFRRGSVGSKRLRNATLI